MSDTEARLYDELVNTTRKLAARGVPVSYSVIADVADAMERAHRDGRSSLREIAKGLDAVRNVERQHRAATVAHRQAVFNDEGVGILTLFAVVTGVAATGATMAGFNTGHAGWFYCAAFLVVVAGAFLLPLVIGLWNR